jgi:hypothetical protein
VDVAKRRQLVIEQFALKHGVEIDEDGVDALAAKIEAGAAMWLGDFDDGCKRYAVKHGARNYQVIYDPADCVIRTVIH